MANLPFDRLANRHFSNGLSGSSVTTFEFKTIGKEPALLQRISAPNPSIQMEDDRDYSPTSSQDPNEFIPANVPTETLTTRHPSLQDRLSMFGSPNYVDVSMSDSTEVNFSRRSVSIGLPSSHILSPEEDAHTTASQVASTNIEKQSTSQVPNHEVILPSPISPSSSNSPISFLTSVPSHKEISSIFDPDTPMRQRPPDVRSTLLSAVNKESSLESLQAIHDCLVSSVTEAEVDTPGIGDAMRAAQAAKNQCAEVLSSAHLASELAEHALELCALVSAQQSTAAAWHCFSVAESVQSWTNKSVTLLERMNSAQGPFSATIQNWRNDRQAHEDSIQRELKEKEESQRKWMAAHQRSSSSSRLATSSGPSSGSSQQQPIAMTADESQSIPFLRSVEHDFDASTREWSKVLEQQRAERAERERQLDEEQRELREAEEQLELKKIKAAAEAEARTAEWARAKAGRIEAEERKRRWKEKEEREAELKAQEYKCIHEEEVRQRVIAQRKASEEHPQRTSEAHQAAVCVIHETKNFLHAKADDERNQALPQRPNPSNIERLRARVAAERASAEAQMAQKPQENLPEDNQAIKSSLPRNPTISTSSQAILPMNTAPRDFGNVVSKKTILSAQSVHIYNNVPVSLVPGPAPVHVPTHITTLPSSVASSASSTNARREFPSSLPPKPTRNPLPTRTAIHRSSVNPRDAHANSGVKTPLPARSTKETPNMDGSPIPGFSHYPMKSASQSNVAPADISVNAMGSDLGNVMLVRRESSGLMIASGAPNHQVKQEGHEEKSALRLERRSGTAISQGANLKATHDIPPKALKNEPQYDIPLLSLPSPPASRPTPPPLTAIAAPPAFSATLSGQHLPEVQTPVLSPPSGPTAVAARHINARTSAATATSQQASAPVVGPPTHVQTTVQALAPISLPARPLTANPPLGPSLSAPEIASRTPAANAFDDSSRMGPDASISVGWSQLNLMEEELPPSRSRSRAAPPLMIDHYSPSPPPYSSNNLGNRSSLSRKHLRKSRRMDHYSPDRSGFSPPSSRSRSVSGNNSRAVSPNQRYGPVHYARPRSADHIANRPPSPVTGQKRGRDEQDVAGPSITRLRYEEPPLPIRPREPNGGLPYSSTGVHQEEWSNTAAYARSPSPDPFSLPPAPLAARIAGEPDPQSAARPRRYDPPPRRQPNYHPPMRGSAPSPTRYRGAHNDSRPPLLERFTDSRAPRSNQRHGPPLPLEDRIAGKNSLFDRLQ
ncbi:hypothetical protein CPB84DRAFT_1801007 [Gymnopilus junonius]|uniref:Uncharacterized protein n=1 Tax=Gymnopilus junonius TaxID=109634 RepID=A0A9P5N9H7_GYMJU|nr:hypothetical protein CPB84DRAFT_1801007 [Gymnopilus junonius]